MIAALLLRLGIPERLHRALTYVAIALVCLAVIWWWFRQHDAKVIERHQDEIQRKDAPASERAAEDRAQDTINNVIAEKSREAEIAKAEAAEQAKAPEARATIPPQNRALNCERLRRAGMTGEKVYREVCQ